MSHTSTLSIKPVIHYPRVAQVGKTYLMTIDLQPEEEFEWQYEEEEYPIYCSVDSQPFFKATPVGEPIIMMHRFGGSFEISTFSMIALSSSDQGTITISLENAWGFLVEKIKLDQIRIEERETAKSTWFWRGNRNSKVDLSNQYFKAHRLIRMSEEETPAGTEGDVYIGQCGLEVDAWGIGTSPMLTTGSKNDAIQAGIPLCLDCAGYIQKFPFLRNLDPWTVDITDWGACFSNRKPRNLIRYRALDFSGNRRILHRLYVVDMDDNFDAVKMQFQRSETYPANNLSPYSDFPEDDLEVEGETVGEAVWREIQKPFKYIILHRREWKSFPCPADTQSEPLNENLVANSTEIAVFKFPHNLNRNSLKELIFSRCNIISRAEMPEIIAGELANIGFSKGYLECPKCRNYSVICCYTYVGDDPLYYFDNYCHVCLNDDCDYGKHDEEREAVGCEPPPQCPFCSRKPMSSK
jgi:hypothetical protein